MRVQIGACHDVIARSEGLRHRAAVIASLATLAGVQSAPAGATPVIPFAPIRQWQFSDIDPDGTEVVVAQGTDVAGDLFRRHDFGPATIPEGPS